MAPKKGGEGCGRARNKRRAGSREQKKERLGAKSNHRVQDEKTLMHLKWRPMRKSFELKFHERLWSVKHAWALLRADFADTVRFGPLPLCSTRAFRQKAANSHQALWNPNTQLNEELYGKASDWWKIMSDRLDKGGGWALEGVVVKSVAMCRVSIPATTPSQDAVDNGAKTTPKRKQAGIKARISVVLSHPDRSRAEAFSITLKMLDLGLLDFWRWIEAGKISFKRDNAGKWRFHSPLCQADPLGVPHPCEMRERALYQNDWIYLFEDGQSVLARVIIDFVETKAKREKRREQREKKKRQENEMRANALRARKPAAGHWSQDELQARFPVESLPAAVAIAEERALAAALSIGSRTVPSEARGSQLEACGISEAPPVVRQARRL